MRAVTVAAIAVVLLALGGVVLLGASGGDLAAGVGGSSGVAGGDGGDGDGDGFGSSGDGASLSVTWTSDTAVPSNNNHHAVAVGRVDGTQTVYAPVSSTRDVDACALVALDPQTGVEGWRDPVPSANCTVHAVADPTVADYDRDGTTEVLATTTERVVVAYAPGGEIERRWNLSAYGYTKPLVADVTGDDAPEVVVADSRGLVQVLEADGGVAWQVDRDGYVWGTPVVGDVDDDDAVEVVVAGSDGRIVSYTADGDVDWEHGLDGESVTWMTAADADDDGVREFYLGTPAGVVYAVDGTGERRWTTDRGDLSAVSAVLADDRRVGVFVTAADGTVARLDAETGDVVWEQPAATDAVQMMPPPVAGDVDGDGDPELVVAANDGTVSVFEPGDGSALATRTHDDRVFAAPVLADVDDDGRAEIFVIYADGTVRRFDYE